MPIRHPYGSEERGEEAERSLSAGGLPFPWLLFTPS